MKQPEFGQKVAEYRKKQGLTQKELAEKCKMNVRSIQRIEAGTVNPRTYTIKLIAKVLEFEDEINFEKENNLTAILSDLFSFKRSNNNTKIQLRVAWIAGLIYFTIGIPEFAFDILHERKSITGVTYFVYIVVSIISILATIYFYKGFLVLGNELQNTIIYVSAYIIILVSIATFFIEIISFGNDDSLKEIIIVSECITFGFLGVLFGIGLLRMETIYGNIAKYAGLLEILAGLTFIKALNCARHDNENENLKLFRVVIVAGISD